MAFWRRGRKKSTSSEAKEEDDDLAKLQRQFGIKPVSDVDIQAEFQQLFGNGNKSEMDSIFGAIHSHEDDEEEAKILRELNIRGSMDQDLSDLSDTDAEIKNIINEADVMAKQQEKIVGKPEVLESFGKFQRANSVENASSKVQVLKQQAVQLKREGKIQEALALFREAKALEQGDIKTSTSVQSAPSCSSISVPSGIPPYQAQILSQTMNEAVTIAAIAPLVDEQEVEVTEDDMQDPEFLAELAKFGLNDVSSQTDSVESFESQILVTKQKALALKRENKISEALQCMREVKDLETKLRNLKQKQQDTPTKVQALPAKQQLKTVELEISSTTVLSSTSTVAHVNYHEQFNCSIPNALEENNVKVTEKDLNDPVYEEELKKLGLAPSAKYDQASIAAHISASAPANTAKQECQRSFQYRNSSIGEYDLIDEFEENEGDDATTPTFLLPCEKSDPNINLAIVGTTCCAHTESTAIVDEVEESIQVNVTQVSSSLTSTTIAESIVEITQLQSQLQKTKESALKLKREGNMKEALEMMRRVKQIEALIEKKQQKLSMTENNSTNCKFETTSSSNLTVTSVQNSARDQKLDQIEKLLVDFANKTMKDAKEWLPKDRAKAAELVNQVSKNQRQILS
jgi:tetratricopeptide (TPR) repeat protein